jgi:DDE_Tnp_1-associated
LPAQSRMPTPAPAQEALAELAAHAASLDAASGGNLLECFASVPDPRHARGIRHSLASVLALCTAAVRCGHTSIEDVTAWVAAAPQQVLAAAGCRRNDLGACVAPHPDTVLRIFTALGAQPLADCAGAFLAHRARQDPVAFPVTSPDWLPAIAADGKAMRGAIGQDGQVPYLLAAAVHGTGTVIAERLIGPKTSEVPSPGG